MKYSLHIPKYFLCLFLIAACLGQRSYKGDKIKYKYELFPETPKLLDIYISEARKKSEIERSATDKEKTGVFTGAYAINPFNVLACAFILT